MALKRLTLTTEVIRFLRPFLPLALIATSAGALAGLATVWLLATMNLGLHDQKDAGWSLLASFVGLCILSVVGTAIAGTLNSVMGQKLVAAIRKDISARILRAPIAALETFESYRLLATLTNDVDTVSVFTFNSSGYVIAFAITLGSFVYLLLMSPIVFLATLVSFCLGAGLNIVAKRSWIHDYEDVRVAQDDLHKQYHAIIEGAKELKINRNRRTHVYGALLSGAADRISHLKSHAMQRFWLAEAAGSAIYFVLIGLLLAGRNVLGIDVAEISGTVIVLLYIRGPVSQITSALPLLDQARVSFQRIAALSADLNQYDSILAITPTRSAIFAERVIRIELRGVTYAFPARENAKPFVLGPIDLTIAGGELLFIIGENGSGKTTLVKLLLGLYEPQKGTVLLNGKPVIPATCDDYRQMFTTVFSDYYLFDDLIYGSSLPEDALPYLDKLDIGHKVTVKDGHFSTIDLSTGQKKRLALVHAYLEKKPIIVTDEWAADQDPSFRRIFYTELLPELKREGKTLIVVSHDDRYFDAADRIIRMENGRVVEDRKLSRSALASGGAS